MATGPVRTEVTLPPLSAAEQALMNEVEKELRCLVCQNETLAESPAELASDLRNQVHELVASGSNDDQIKEYIDARYGAFVMYRPPLQGNTALLWGGPFALLAVGAASWFIIQRRQKLAVEQNAKDQAESGPGEKERARARALLDDSSA